MTKLNTLEKQKKSRISCSIVIVFINSVFGTFISPLEAKVDPLSIPKTEVEYGSIRESLSSSFFTQVKKEKRPSFKYLNLKETGLHVSHIQPSSIVSTQKVKPYDAIVQLEVKFKGQKDPVKATGAFISSRDIITVAHSLYNRDRGLFAESVTIKLNEETITTKIFDTSSVYKESISGGYANDYGVVSFDHDISSNFFSPTAISASLLQYSYNVTGYPNAETRELRTTKGLLEERILQESSELLLFYPFHMEGGQSGSPLWRVCPKSNMNTCIGIHEGEVNEALYKGYGVGVRFTEAIVKDIKRMQQSNALRNQTCFERIRRYFT